MPALPHMLVTALAVLVAVDCAVVDVEDTYALNKLKVRGGVLDDLQSIGLCNSRGFSFNIFLFP